MTDRSRNQLCPCGSGRKFKQCCGKANSSASLGGNKCTLDAAFRHLIELGLSHHQRGELIQALCCYDKALRMQPLDAGLLGLKGMVLHQQGQQEDAKVLIDHGLTINPRDPRLHNYLAQVQDALGDSFGAELSFIQAVRLDPHYLEAWWNAGKSMLKHHRAKEAIHALSQAYRLAPNDGEIILDLVEAHFLARDLTKAVSLLGKASRLGYAPEAVRAWLGAVLQGLGRDEEAKNCALVPGLNSDLECQRAAEAMHKIGRAELHLGNLESAEHWLNEAITINPDVAGLYADLVATRKFTDSDESLLVKMKQLLSDSPQGEHRELEFALGKAYADIGQHDLSFSHYLAGNDLVRSKVHFDASAHHEYISQLVEIFSRERLQELPMGSDSNIPILIVGTPRSGTTLTESIISSHSEIAGAGEMEFWSRVKPHWSKVFPKAYTKELAVRLAHEYLMFMRNHSTTAARITDKMPGNFMHLGIIHSVLPKAKLIHIKRHPIDACLSIYFQNFPNGHSYKWDLESLAFWYEQYQRIMAHWRSILPADTLFEFWYEDLVEDTEGVSRQVMEFLGLEWEPGQLDYHKKERAIFTASKWQVRQPIYKSSKERWRKFEKHLGPLLPLLKYSREGA